MEISSPLCITSRLLPGCRIGGADISIEYMPGYYGITPDGRQRYRWYIDLPDGGREFRGYDLASAGGGGTLQLGLESLLGYLGAFAEAHIQQGNTDQESAGPLEENACLFPVGLAEWAVQNVEAIAEMEAELQEHPNKLIVE